MSRQFPDKFPLDASRVPGELTVEGLAPAALTGPAQRLGGLASTNNHDTSRARFLEMKAAEDAGLPDEPTFVILDEPWFTFHYPAETEQRGAK